MKLVETKVTSASVHMRYADNLDPSKATQWVDFQVPIDAVWAPDGPPGTPSIDPERQGLGEIRLAALRHARGVIGDETRRISELFDRRR